MRLDANEGERARGTNNVKQAENSWQYLVVAESRLSPVRPVRHRRAAARAPPEIAASGDSVNISALIVEAEFNKT